MIEAEIGDPELLSTEQTCRWDCRGQGPIQGFIEVELSSAGVCGVTSNADNLIESTGFTPRWTYSYLLEFRDGMT